MTCTICLAPSASPQHRRCLVTLFGAPKLPGIDLDEAKLHTVALAMVGHTTLSGAQRKISLDSSADRTTLQVAVGSPRYVLKPQAGTYPGLPENEHLTMRLAALVGIATPANGLIVLVDGTWAYLVRRFDRRDDGSKVAQEDFCQLAELMPQEKYQGTAPLCARLVRRFATEPAVELRRLFLQLVFSWWCGNGDLHLKNLSLGTDRDGYARLTPAYDLLNTRIIIAADPLALTVGGRRDRLTQDSWLTFARHIGLPERAAVRAVAAVTSRLPAALELTERSFLPSDLKRGYAEVLRERTAALSRARPPTPHE